MADPANTTTASTTATLARSFITALRAAGHRPYIAGSGRFGIMLGVSKPTAPAPVHHNGPEFCYPLGVDDRPLLALRDDPNWIGVVAAQLSN